MPSISIHEELWNIFTYYSLHGNPRDPSRINATQYCNFCRDTLLFDPSMTDVALTPPKAHLLFTSQITLIKSAFSNSVAAGVGKLNFEEFLTLVLRTAKKCYPSQKTLEGAMQQLLMDNVLPLSSRRKPISECTVIAAIEKDSEEIEKLWKIFENPMQQLFQYYASAAEGAIKFKSKEGSEGSGKTFDEIAAERSRKKMYDNAHIHGSNSSTGVKSLGKGSNSMISQIGYDQFLKFCFELGLSSNLNLTTIDIGDIYLTTIANKAKAETGNAFDPNFGKFTLPQLWEALIRCAHIAHNDYPEIPLKDKIKQTFSAIWKHMQQLSKMKTRSDGNSSSANSRFRILMKCSQSLNEKFINMWTKDGFVNYLKPEKKRDDISTPLGRMIISSSKDRTSGIEEGNGNDGNNENDADSENENDAERNSPSSKNKNNYTKVLVEIDDDIKFGDPRLTPSGISQLLKSRPDLCVMLKEQIIEAGIAKE